MSKITFYISIKISARLSSHDGNTFIDCIYLFRNTKDFPKERYNTYAKSCNSNLYTKYPGATYSGLLLGTMRCL